MRSLIAKDDDGAILDRNAIFDRLFLKAGDDAIFDRLFLKDCDDAIFDRLFLILFFKESMLEGQATDHRALCVCSHFVSSQQTLSVLLKITGLPSHEAGNADARRLEGCANSWS